MEKQLPTKQSEEDEEGQSSKIKTIMPSISIPEVSTDQFREPDIGSPKDSNGRRSSEPGSDFGFKPILQTVTFSDDGGDEEEAGNDTLSPSPLSKLNGSYWAMMEQYVDDKHMHTDEENEDTTLSNEAFAALINGSIGTSNIDQTPSTTPGEISITTPKRFYDEWNQEGPTATPGSLLRESIAPSDDENDDEVETNDEIMDDAPTPDNLSPEPVPPTSVSPFSTFKHNSSHAALDETKAYLRRIKELQQGIQLAQDGAKKELNLRIEAESRCQHLQEQLQQLKLASHEPKTPSLNVVKSALPKTPVSDPIWERNKTLVKEVRFADQTCVELSGQKRALELEIESLQQQSQSMRDEVESLQSQLTERTRFHVATEARLQMTEKHAVKLESDLSAAEKSLSQSEKKLSEQSNVLSSVEEQLQESQKHATALELDLSAVKQSLAQSEEHVLELESELSATNKQLEQSEKLHEALSSQIELQYKLQSSSSSTADAERTEAILEKEQLSTELKQEKDRSQLEKKQLERIIDEKERDVEAAQALVNSTELGKIEAEKELERVRRECDEAHHQIDSMARRGDTVGLLEREMEQMERKLEAAQSRFQEKEEAILRAETDLKEMQEHLDRSEAKCEATEQQRGALARELDYFMTRKRESEQAQAKLIKQLTCELQKSKDDLTKSGRDLETVRDALVKEKALLQAAELEQADCLRAQLRAQKVADENKDLHHREKLELESFWKGQQECLDQELRRCVDNIKESKRQQEQLGRDKVDLQEQLYSLKQQFGEMKEDLLSANAEVESMKHEIEGKTSKLLETEDWLKAMKEESKSLMLKLAGSATEESDSEKYRMEETLEVLRNRLFALVERLGGMQLRRDQDSIRCAGISSVETEQLVDPIPPASGKASRVEASESRLTVCPSPQSELIGTTLLSSANETHVVEPEPATVAKSSKSLALNTTQYLERMEEARAESTIGSLSPSISTIAGMSHLLDNTFLSDRDVSPTKTPGKSRSNNLSLKGGDTADEQLRLPPAGMDQTENIAIAAQRQLKRGAVADIDTAGGDGVDIEKEDLSFGKKSQLQKNVEGKSKHAESLYLESGKDETFHYESTALLKEQTILIKICSQISQLLDCDVGEDYACLPDKVSEFKQEIAARRSDQDAAIKGLLRERDLLLSQARDRESMMEEKISESQCCKEYLVNERKHVAQLSKSNESLCRDVDRLRLQQAESDKLFLKLAEAAETERDRLDVEARNQFEELARQNAKCEMLSEKSEKLSESLVIKSDKCEQLERLVSQKVSEIEDLRGLIDKKSDEFDQLEAKHGEAIRELERTSKGFQKLKEDEAWLMRQRDDTQFELESKNALIIELQESVAQFNEDLAQANNETASLQNTLLESDEALARLKASFIECNERLVESKERHQANTQELESAKLLAESTGARLLDAESHLIQEKERRKEADAENKVMGDKVAKMENELRNYQKLVPSLETKNKELAGAILCKDESLIEAQRLREQLKISQEEMDTKTDAFQTEIQNLQEALDSLSESKAALERTVRTLEKESDQKKSALVEQALFLETSETKCQRLKDYARKLARKCDEWEDFFEKQSGVVAGLREAREESRQKASDLARRCHDRDQVRNL